MALACALQLCVSWASDRALPDGYVQLRNVTYAQSYVEGERPEIGWRALTLPDRWVPERRWLQSRTGWYRVELDPILRELGVAPATGGESLAVYLQRVSVNARVYLNNELVGSGGQFEEPLARNMHRPLFFSLPRSALKPQGNELLVELKVYPGFAHLVAARVGFDAALRPTFERQFFLQVTLSQWLFVVAALCALFGFVFWIFVERESVNLFFGLTAFSWSIYCLNLFIRDIPFSADLWWVMIHTNLEWAAVFLVFFAHRLCGVQRPHFERLLVVFASASTIFYFSVGLEDINWASRLMHSGTLLLMLYMNIWLIYRFIKTRSPEAALLAVCLLGTVLLGFNDLVRHTVPIDSPNWQTRFYLLQFGAPAMFIIIAAYLTRRYAFAAKRAGELQLRQHEARLNERQRIYQDLHDDVGAKLLGLVYSAKTDSEAALARSALADIRDIVSDSALEAEDLLVVVERMRAEADNRCSAAGLQLMFDHSVEKSRSLPGETVYHLIRMLRELLSNTIKHAGARQVEVVLLADAQSLTLRYRDDGSGLSEDYQPGHGLAGLERRARTLGGEMTLFQNALATNGFMVEITVPLVPQGSNTAR